ncbi:glycosyltransferase family 4 protein [Lapillicoccus sp.]|uniref:glycosyltransferase family 4 protein n=1 Tax=Lapillicoccus sp. TaxID=1909287 RepID=UPI003983461D
MRVAIVSESFLPSTNGVTTSVCRVADRLRAEGHEALIVAPSPAPPTYNGYAVHSARSFPVRQFQVGLPTGEIEAVLARFAPDVVHAASPFVLGASGLIAADRLGLPSVAVYQTDLPSYLRQHGRGLAGSAAEAGAWRWIRRIHSLADLTLAPSAAAADDLLGHGIPRVRRWGRGVDTALFHPGWRHDAGSRAIRRALAPRGETLLGYVGRLAPEKELHRLVEIADLPGTRLVLVGDGPARAELERLLPGAAFLGLREGDDLARAYAAFDAFVHTGTRETFGQTLQEAAATGLPVVAPAAGGPLDLVEHGRTGYLFDPHRAGSLRLCTQALLDADHRGVLGRAGLARVAPLSWASVVSDLVGHYDDVIGSRVGHAA